MPQSKYQLFTQIKQLLRRHPDWTDEQVTEHFDLRFEEKDLIAVVRRDLEAG